MKPRNIGHQYDKIANWWNERHYNSEYGLGQVETALDFAFNGTRALDVGCGSGGRFIQLLQSRGYDVTGLDASKKMIDLAKASHSDCNFVHAEIETWKTDHKFDFILAWDCLFHLPLELQEPVLSKLCGLLAEGGTMIHTFGDGFGEHTDQWHGQTFYYSSIGISKNVEILQERGLRIRLLDVDQFPEKHVFAISRRE